MTLTNSSFDKVEQNVNISCHCFKLFFVCMKILLNEFYCTLTGGSFWPGTHLPDLPGHQKSDSLIVIVQTLSFWRSGKYHTIMVVHWPGFPISFSISIWTAGMGSDIGPTRATVFPSWSTTNLVKFHLIPEPKSPPSCSFSHFHKGSASFPFTSTWPV